MLTRFLFCLLLGIFILPQPSVAQSMFGPAVPEPPFEKADIKQILKDLPKGQRWITHVKKDLLPFWTMDEALGKPKGNFPTYRCNDGSLYDPKNPCPELSRADPGIVKLNRDYTRAKSRQVFAYGVAYHMTGDESLLLHAMDGAQWLEENALDSEHGGAFSWFESDKGKPATLQRTSQDLAYAVSGFALLYYLTRDQKYLDIVVNLKQHIFRTYYDDNWGLLRWVKEKNADDDRPGQKELVSQLDQVYGYMLWTTMALDDPDLRRRWMDHLDGLAEAMRTQFFAGRYGLYWGAITTTETRNLGTPHTDFGHSIKTLWLTYRIGLLTDNVGLVNFAKPRMASILSRAYIPETGSWARGYKIAQSNKWIIDHDKEWWSLAELDQTTATLALVEPAFASVLPKTYRYWFTHMVDHKHGGVWHMVKGDTDKPDLSLPKQHSWKNAFHVFEHALIGYLTGQQLHDEPVVLHYAFKQDMKIKENAIRPYFYFADIGKQTRGTFQSGRLKNYTPTKVMFTSLR